MGCSTEKIMNDTFNVVEQIFTTENIVWDQEQNAFLFQHGNSSKFSSKRAAKKVAQKRIDLANNFIKKTFNKEYPFFKMNSAGEIVRVLYEFPPVLEEMYNRKNEILASHDFENQEDLNEPGDDDLNFDNDKSDLVIGEEETAGGEEGLGEPVYDAPPMDMEPEFEESDFVDTDDYSETNKIHDTILENLLEKSKEENIPSGYLSDDGNGGYKFTIDEPSGETIYGGYHDLTSGELYIRQSELKSEAYPFNDKTGKDYSFTAEIGTQLDDIFRFFFIASNENKEYGYSDLTDKQKAVFNGKQELFEKYLKNLKAFREDLIADGYTNIITQHLTLRGPIDGLNIAGTVDMLAYKEDANGKRTYKIIDLKTSKHDKIAQKKLGYAFQLTAYKKLLAKHLNISEEEIESAILPVKIERNEANEDGSNAETIIHDIDERTELIDPFTEKNTPIAEFDLERAISNILRKKTSFNAKGVEAKDAELLGSNRKKYIKQKEKILEHTNQKISSLYADARIVEITDPALAKRLKKKAESFRVLKEELEENLVFLRSNPTFGELYHHLNEQIKKDIANLRNVAKNGDVSDLKEALSLVEYYKDIVKLNGRDGKSHPIFSSDELNSGDITEKILSTFSNRYRELENIETLLKIRQEKVASNELQDFFGREVSLKDISEREQGRADINWFDMYLMDMKHGVFSSNGEIPQLAWMYMSNMLDEGKSDTAISSEKTEELAEKVAKILAAGVDGVSYSLKGFGIGNSKGVSYDLFYAKDEFGHDSLKLIDIFNTAFGKNLEKLHLDHIKQVKNTRDTTTDPSVRARLNSLNKEEYLDNIREQADVLDITKLDFGSPELNREMSDILGVEIIPDTNYLNSLASLYTTRGVQMLTKRQVEKIRLYEARKEAQLEAKLLEEGVDSKSDLREKTIADLELSNKKYNPVENVEIFNGKESSNFESGNLIFLPKDPSQIEEKFKSIANNDTLFEFYEHAKESMQKIYDNMGVDIQKGSIGYLKMTDIFEILASREEVSLFEALIEASKIMWERIKKSFTFYKEGVYSHDVLDPYSGEKAYNINDQFVTTNSRQINSLLFAKLSKFKTYQDHNAKITKYTSFSYESLSKDALDYLVSQTGMSHSAFQNMYRNKEIYIKDLLNSAATQEVIKDRTMDLPKILNYYTARSNDYAARKKALPVMEVLKKYYFNLNEAKTNNVGEIIQTAIDSDENFKSEGKRKNAMKQYNDWERRVLYGYNLDMDKHKGVIDEKKGKTFKVPKKISSSGKMTFDGKVLSKKEKAIEAEIDEAISLLQKNPEENQKELAILYKKKASIGSNFSLTAGYDNLLNFIRFQGLGWNLPASLTNFMAGTMSNMVNSAGGEHFPPAYIFEGYRVVLGSFIKNITFGKVASRDSLKLASLMGRFDILQDASNELQKASYRTGANKYKEAVNPYEVIRRTEYVNQGPLAYAVLKDTKIIGKDGKETSVWEAMDENGRISDENFRTAENISNWEMGKGIAHNKFQARITTVIEEFHGNYNDRSGMMAKSGAVGKTLLMYKGWLPNMIYNRFGVEEKIESTGVVNKGRYRSLNTTSATTLATVAGLAMIGPVGALALGLGTAGYSMFYKPNPVHPDKSPVGYMLYEIGLMGKTVGKYMFGMPINLIAGKEVIKAENNFEDYKLARQGQEGDIDIDIRNFKKTMVDVACLLSLVLLQLLIKAFLWDPDDEKEDPGRRWHNGLINQTTQLITESTMFLNPLQMKETVVGIPVIRFFENVGKLGIAISKASVGKDTIASGTTSGQSRLKNATMALTPASMKAVVALDYTGGFAKKGDRQYKPLWSDKLFNSRELNFKERATGRRAKYRRELTGTMPKKQVKAMVDAKYPTLRQSDATSYEELFKMYKKRDDFDPTDIVATKAAEKAEKEAIKAAKKAAKELENS